MQKKVTKKMRQQPKKLSAHFFPLLNRHHRHTSLTIIANINITISQILQLHIVIPTLFNGRNLLVHTIKPDFNRLLHFITPSLFNKRQRVNTCRIVISPFMYLQMQVLAGDIAGSPSTPSAVFSSTLMPGLT